MTPLQEALGDYLRLRRALGHKLDDAGRQLTKFVACLDDAGETTVTMHAVNRFVLDPDLDPAATVRSRRLVAVRGFARYLSGIDPDTEIPPAGMVTYRARRRTPFVFSAADVEAVARSAAATSPFPFRQATLDTMIGLLAVTGMRIGEVTRLDRGDIDWDNAVILVRESKFTKSRNVPISATTIEALTAYRHRRDRPRQAAARLFVSLAGTPVAHTHFGSTFRLAVDNSGVARDSVIRPRVHDLRHSFAIRTLTGWYRDGLDIEALLPRLSTYLGHAEPRFTYRYLTAIPELLGHAASRLETSLAGAQ